MISANEALERLRQGNRRFVSGERRIDERISPARRAELTSGQQPFAAVLGCSDSRVPAEIVFDQGLGDLFTIRVVGNIATPPQIGSIEYAADQLGARLVVVLGHSNCGSIKATFQAIEGSADDFSPHLRSIVDRIRPSVEALQQTAFDGDQAALTRHAVRANVHASVEQLRRESAVLDRLVREQGLLIVGAEYSLETGAVEFLESAPGQTKP